MKQEEKNRRSRECIEEAAIRSFARQGPDNANLNQLCRENGISKGKLYHYYASKDDLLVACVQRIVDRLVADICAFSPDPEQGVAANLHVYYKERIDFWCDDPEALSLIWYCLHLTNEALRSRLTEQSHRFDACMKNKTLQVHILPLEIIHTAHERVNVSDEELYSTMRVMYNHLLIKYMHRVVDLKAEGDTAGMERERQELLHRYDRFIQILLYGILA
jgi:AcrR family transcriptional regulator